MPRYFEIVEYSYNPCQWMWMKALSLGVCGEMHSAGETWPRTQGKGCLRQGTIIAHVGAQMYVTM